MLMIEVSEQLFIKLLLHHDNKKKTEKKTSLYNPYSVDRSLSCCNW